MILTICPNPSIDCTIELDSLNVGMLNRIHNKVETYSGKALNVAIGVARLEEKCVATGFMFADHERMFNQVLGKEGVETDFVVCDGSARVNYKIIDKRSMLTEINDRGENVTLDKQNALLDKIAALSSGADIAVMGGSLPKGVSPEFYGKALINIPQRVKVIVDAEKDNMLAAVSAREIYMVKPNIKELESYAETKINDFNDVIKASAKYLDKGVKYVLTSMGTEGAVLTDGVDSYFCKTASVAVNSTVGAGDSMVAAAAVAIYNGVSMREILKEAVAAGTAAVTTSGTNLFYKDKYKEIYSKIQPVKL